MNFQVLSPTALEDAKQLVLNAFDENSPQLKRLENAFNHFSKDCNNLLKRFKEQLEKWQM